MAASQFIHQYNKTEKKNYLTFVKETFASEKLRIEIIFAPQNTITQYIFKNTLHFLETRAILKKLW